MLRVGRIPYLNCEPFFAPARPASSTWPLNPAPSSARPVAAGRLDAGPLSLVDRSGSRPT